MNFFDIPMYNVLPEVENCVIELFLQNSDKATLLGNKNCGLQNIYDLYGTEYEDIISAYISSREGESFGMCGMLFDFRLTDELKAHIRRSTLTGAFKVGNGYILENLTLYSNEKRIFTCCSHEAFDLDVPELIDEMTDGVLQAVKTTIERTELFARMQTVNNGIAERQEAVEKDLSILLDLCCYVDQAKGWFAYQPPEYKCDFVAFCQIAERYLTQSTYSVLEKADGFADLQPLPVPQTVDEVLAASDKTYGLHYSYNDYYRQVKSEILMLRYVRQNS